MEVRFTKLVEERGSTWEADCGRGRTVPGSAVLLGHGGLPRDLVQLVIEAELGVDHGFWGSLATGGGGRGGERRRTRTGQIAIARRRGELVAAEQVVGRHFDRWERGLATPAEASLDRMAASWAALREGESLTVEWPTLRLRWGDAAAA